MTSLRSAITGTQPKASKPDEDPKAISTRLAGMLWGVISPVKNLVSTIATIWRLSLPYFRSEDRWPARILLAAVVTLELSIVGIQVILNQWYNRFYNTLEDRDWNAFVSAILFFCVLAAIYTVVAVYQVYLNQWLQIRWRRWMTQNYLRHWLNAANHYRMQLLGDAADNPDQRIAEDLQLFVEFTLSISIGILNSIVTLVLFHRHPVDVVGARAAACLRRKLRHSRLSGVGGADLCGDRHDAHASESAASSSPSISSSSASKPISVSISCARARIPSRSPRSAARRPNARVTSTVSAAWSAIGSP